jgi:transcriptional regulator with XRE-family HTH domain
MVTRIETGQTNITVEQLARIADELQVAPATLLRGITLATLAGITD